MLDLIGLVNAGSIALVITGAVHTLGTTINGVFIDISGANW
jgi:Flp pilus assembly pilin Flp